MTNTAGSVNWVCSYWTSTISREKYEIRNLVTPSPEAFLIDTLDGNQRNVEVAQLMTYFDYLKSSDVENEKSIGEFFFDTLKKIVKLSLTNGHFKYVSRTTLEPIVTQNGFDVGLNKLSSGNLFFIQRMISLLGKMYSVGILNNTPLEKILYTPGFILVDEAENHLHPKWQKVFLKNVLDIFPNMQIILTTHSPFIVSSYPNAKIFVCSSETGYSSIMEMTEEYSNKPIDEILLTPIFQTQPFNEEISGLIRKRKEAILSENDAARKQIESELIEKNPEYFAYLKMNEKLKKS